MPPEASNDKFSNVRRQHRFSSSQLWATNNEPQHRDVKVSRIFDAVLRRYGPVDAYDPVGEKAVAHFEELRISVYGVARPIHWRFWLRSCRSPPVARRSGS
jgi:hypothetical protein